MSPILLFILFLVIGILAAFLIRCHLKKHYHKCPVKPSDLPCSDVIFHLGFVAADADGSLFIFDRMPVRDLERKAWYPRPDNNPSDRGCFEANFLHPTVTLTWDDEPRLCYFSIFNTDNE